MSYLNDNDEFTLGAEPEYIDIDGTIEAIREAWKCAPNSTLSELLDEVTPMPFCELTNDELIQSLNEYILQNHQG